MRETATEELKRRGMLSLWVYEQPVAKERPICGRGRARTGAKTKAAEEEIGWGWRTKYGPEPLTGPLRVDLQFSETGKRARDIDNLAKLVLDALNGVAWVDDAQVVQLLAEVTRQVPKDEASTFIAIFSAET